MSQIIRVGGIFHQQDDYDKSADLNISVAADELVIPVTHAYVGKTTGTDAEALTLADGKPGQVLIINLETDGGGDATLTQVTEGHRNSAWATIVFADEGDQAILWYATEWSGWLLLSLTGPDGPPVHTV